MTYLLQEEFTTADANPVADPRTCEPGPGSLHVVDTGGANSRISGGRLLFDRLNGSGWANEGWITIPSYTRVPGMMFGMVGTDNGDSCPIAPTTSSTLPAFQLGPTWGSFNAAFTSGSDYYRAWIMRGQSGYVYLVKGVEYSSWTILFVSGMGMDRPLYVGGNGFDGFPAGPQVERIFVLQKSGAWLNDYGKAFLFNPLVESGYTGTGLADALTYVTWFPDTGDVFNLYVRYTDANNHIRIEGHVANSTFKLFKRVSGTDTQLDTAAQTWRTDQHAYRIGAVCYGSTIDTYIETMDTGQLAVSHVTETANQSATGVKVSGANGIANLEVWPRTLSGTDENDV